MTPLTWSPDHAYMAHHRYGAAVRTDGSLKGGCLLGPGPFTDYQGAMVTPDTPGVQLKLANGTWTRPIARAMFTPVSAQAESPATE